MRLYTIVVSIGAHLAALVILVAVPLVAMDAIPIARRIPDFIKVTAAELPEVPPPPRGGNPPAARDVVLPSIPTQAPNRIEPEVVSSAPPGVTLFDGAGGVPDGVGGPGLLNILPPPAPPARRESAPMRVGGDIRPPTKIKHVSPVYPALAQSVKREGTVILEAVISEKGEVSQLRVLRSIDLLDSAAMDAVRQWRFTPTLLNGQPVPVVMTVTVTFRLT
jgi:protein TonB